MALVHVCYGRNRQEDACADSAEGKAREAIYG